MANIQKYINKHFENGFMKTLFKNISIEHDVIELSIKIENRNINIRELSSYFDLIYRIDGLMSHIGYKKYVHNYNAQIEITEVRIGSWETIIQENLNSIGAEKLFILWLSLKYLPSVVNQLLDVASKSVDILDKREVYLEKKEKRHLRKHIRDLINEEVELSALNKSQKEKMVDFLDEIYVTNKKRLIPSSRFSRKYVKSINLSVGKKKKD
jgi:uncharacterized protein (DUF2164 family)